MGRRASSWVLAPALAVLAAAPAACGDDAPCPERPTTVVEERAVDVAHRGPDLDVDALLADPIPGLIVEVTNSQPSVERVRVALDGDTALDVDLPAAAECRGGHNPVFAAAYDRPPGPVEVVLDVQGETSSTTIEVPETGTVWVVSDVQSQRAWGDLQVYETRPIWG